jgi:hypothetical protein
MAGFQPERAQASHAGISQYWQARMTATLDRLEREARRMFQLERELHGVLELLLSGLYRR